VSAIEFGMNARLWSENWRPATEEIAFAAGVGFRWMQFNDRAAGLNETALGAPFVAVAGALAARQIGAVLEIMPRVDATGHSSDGRTPLDVLEANLPAITALRVARVHWHVVFEDPQRAELARGADWLVPQLAAATAWAAREGFRFAIEPNDALYPALSHPAEFAALLAAVPGLGLVWDLNHTAPAHYDAFLALATRMTMLHIADTRLPVINEHRPIGQGNVDFTALVRRLIVAGFRGPAILEIGGLPQSGGYGQDTDTALTDSLARLYAALASP